VKRQYFSWMRGALPLSAPAPHCQTHLQRGVVVHAEDDDLGSDITDPNVVEDLRLVERNLAGHWRTVSNETTTRYATHLA
jgi:hypothetical protein